MRTNQNITAATQSVFSDSVQSQQQSQRKSNLSFPFWEKLNSFNRSALQELSGPERILFELFGKGKEVEVAFNKIHLAFEQQVKKNPQKIAAEHRGESITYGELNKKAECLAELLVQYGVKPGDNVGLFIRRSLAMLVGMLGILKAGAAYVPQDIKIAPENQLKSIVGDANIKVVLSLTKFQDCLPKLDGVKTLFVDDLESYLTEIQTLNAGSTNSITQLVNDNCFILFTSGTTGKPNGVKVTHKNLCNIILSSPGNLNISSSSKVAQILNIAFDMAAWEIWGALCHGATLLIRDNSIQGTASRANVIIATPSILETINPLLCNDIRSVAVAGEPCAKPLADKWTWIADFYNCCGPTETTIVNTVKKYTSKFEALTIGKPTPNNTVYILDADLKPCPIGAVGEMWAGGDCVTAGYLNNQVLNDERYKPDPFLGEGKLMFRTRDLGRWTLDGELEHLGRTDDQVKIRGFRVELDSISNTLEKHKSCDKAVTLKLTDDNLVAFVVPATADTNELRNTISESLPYYCMPNEIYTMDKVPLTKRGKVDKERLRKKAIQALSQNLAEEEGVTC